MGDVLNHPPSPGPGVVEWVDEEAGLEAAIDDLLMVFSPTNNPMLALTTTPDPAMVASDARAETCAGSMRRMAGSDAASHARSVHSTSRPSA